MNDLPEKGLELDRLPEHFKLDISDKEETGVRIFSLLDTRTGVDAKIVEPNSEFDVISQMAWMGARTSRSDEDYFDLAKEIASANKEGRYTAGEKLARTFVGYNHASVGDMAVVGVFVNKIPMTDAFWRFNHTSVGAGQELSTRYVKLKDLGIPSLTTLAQRRSVNIVPESAQRLWTGVQKELVDLYNKWHPALYKDLEDYLAANGVEDPQKSTLEARTLDAARYWIPAGTRTSQTLVTSVRSVVDEISQLKTSLTPEHQMLGEQLLTVLRLNTFHESSDIKAELGALTKYNEGSTTYRDNLDKLGSWLDRRPGYDSILSSRRPKASHASRSSVEYIAPEKFSSPGEAMAMQYLSVLHPAVDEGEILNFLRKLSDSEKAQMGSIILEGHNHHDLMRNPGDVRGMMHVLDTSMAYLRDLNRQRATGRLIQALETRDVDSIVNSGPNRNIQLELSEYWSKHEPEWLEDQVSVYDQIFTLHELLKDVLEDNYDPNLIMQLLPLGHQMKMHMSGPVIQENYMTSLRIGMGGDFGYRQVVWDMLQQVNDNDPYLRSMGSHLSKPDVNSVEQILGRS